MGKRGRRYGAYRRLKSSGWLVETIGENPMIQNVRGEGPVSPGTAPDMLLFFS